MQEDGGGGDMGPFVAESPRFAFHGRVGQERLLWHPDVHASFGERCFYYLVSGTDSRGQSILGNISNLFGAIGINSATFNVVFGTYDVLIRVWLSAPRRERMLRLLQTSRSGVELDSILEFGADDVFYTWPLPVTSTPWTDAADLRLRSRPASGSLLSEGQIADVHRVSRAGTTDHVESVVDKPELDAAVARLVDDRLLVPYTPPPGVKVCLFISSSSGGVRDSGADSALIGWSLRRIGFEAVSVYAGDGFCDYVAKGVCSAYRASLQLVEQFQRSIQPVGLYSWSLAPADYGDRDEGETLDAVPRVHSDLVQSILRASSQSQSSEMRILERLSSDAAIKNLDELSEWIADNLAPGEQERLLEIAQAALAEDRPEFNQRMSYLIGIEADLRAAVPLVARQFARNEANWRQEFEETFALFIDNSKDTSPDDFYEWKFLAVARIDALFGYLRTVVAGSLAAADFVAGYLGNDWQDGWFDVALLRDAFAHGRLLEQTIGRELDRAWWMRLRTIGESIRIQKGLESMVQRLSLDI